MARVHFVKKARKDNPNAGIKAGESYYWWQHAFAPKQFSKTQPKPSQITQSGFMRTIYEIQEQIDALTTEMNIEDEVDNIKTQLEDLKSECEDNLSNMPDHLQESSVLNERIESLDEMIGEFESLELDIDEETIAQDIKDELPEKEKDETQEEYDEGINEAIAEAIGEKKDEIIEQVQGISYSGS
jgi:chromosome segregation ATPase